MYDISSCGSFLHLAWVAPSGHLTPGDWGSTILLPLALLSLHVPDSSGVPLTEICTFWPLVACQFLQQPWSQWALRTAQCPPHMGELWLHSQSIQSSILPSPVHELQGGEFGDFFTKFSYLQKNSLSCSFILPWRCICFLVWIFLSCFHFLYCLVIFTTCFTLMKAFAEPGFQRGETPADAVFHPSQHSLPWAVAWWAFLLSTLCPGNVILQTIHERAQPKWAYANCTSFFWKDIILLF